METTNAIRDFLLSRRARLRLQDVGLPDDGHRRVSGLRREKVALLAHVSVDHYIRLERGQAWRVSDAVLHAVADALRLTPGERGYLYSLARPSPHPPEEPAGAGVRDSVQHLLDSLTDAPAYVVGRDGAVLAWNHLAAAVFTDFALVPPGRRTIGWLVFTHPQARTVYADWELKARETVAYLRTEWGARPRDRALARQIRELGDADDCFRRLWSEQVVVDLTRGSTRINGPSGVQLRLSWDTFRTTGDPHEVVIAYTAADRDTSAALRGLSAAGRPPSRRLPDAPSTS
ncbi:helix-turn-helix domain-containing protein [Kitasatospora sp. NPDC088783]|uniref:helix-turn-helix domain-containing protein n=1 Tax=Kitasatospora sp. NPDC088783 TaxID=3364077 RepID=UPI00380E3670